MTNDLKTVKTIFSTHTKLPKNEKTIFIKTFYS